MPELAFDSHHPPPEEIIDKCVHCGFCLPACPTYVLWGQEMDSPRGRIYLMKLASDGAIAMTPQWVRHLDTCLGCMACTTACPSGVDYGKLIEATRGQIARRHQRSRLDTLYRRLLFSTFTRPDRLRLLRWPLAAYRKTGLQALVRRSGVLKHLPQRVQTLEALMPEPTKSESVPRVVKPAGKTRRRVGLLLGCVQREFLSHVNTATARVLAAEGCEIVSPPEQPCCGALLMHAGEEADALTLARRLIDVFDREEVDAVVINAGGCGSHVKEFGYLLRDDPVYAERAARFAAKCRDVMEFLAELGPQAARQPLQARVAYHDSCHLQHAQGVRTQPRQLLSQIPGVELSDIPEGPICCGSAGIYNLVEPEAANALGDRKAQLIAPLKADVIATGNPGCILQLRAALARLGQSTPVVHSIELLDASIRGTGSVPF